MEDAEESGDTGCIEGQDAEHSSDGEDVDGDYESSEEIEEDENEDELTEQNENEDELTEEDENEDELTLDTIDVSKYD